MSLQILPNEILPTHGRSKKSSYVVWANKGGIGKSTLSFQLACAAAEANPTKKVYVVDISPQCDVSRMLLGGGHHGGEDKILSLMLATPRMTIQRYLSDCLSEVPAGIGWPDPSRYFVEPHVVRDPAAEVLPNNLRLFCGDFDLERTIQLIESFPQPPRRAGRAPTGPEYSAYLLSRSFLRHLVEHLENQEDCIIIIDTDPYFNVATTHMGLIGASNWISAYSPNSQASQYAVMRSMEFLFEPTAGLSRTITDALTTYPLPWFDNRGNPLITPSFAAATPSILIANMTNPYKRSGNDSYTDPQRLHRQTIAAMTGNIAGESGRYGIAGFAVHEHMWDMRRLGLICDFNGTALHTLELGNNYPEPGSTRKYHLNRTGGTPLQLEGYSQRLGRLARHL